MNREYGDFSVGFESTAGGGYLVRAFSARSEAECQTEVPHHLTGMVPGCARGEGARDALVSYREREERRFDPEDLGQSLFSALFPGPVGELFASEWTAAIDAGRGLRIRLHLRPGNPALAWLTRIPWELLFDKRAGGFMGLNPLTPVVRHLNLTHPAVWLPFRAPIRVLVASANPAGHAPLAVQEEQRRIQEARGREKVIVKVLEDASPEQLRDELLRGRYQVVHFMGHGITDADDGSLIFSSRGTSFRQVTGKEMSHLLQGASTAQLVILNACHSAGVPRSQSADPLAGVAGALVGGGQPAVLGMQFAISDSAALIFSERLYQRLAEGDPLEAAVAEARLAVYLADRRSTDWSAPVLFLRGGDQRVGEEAMKRAEKDIIRTDIKGKVIEGDDEVVIAGESIEGPPEEPAGQRPRHVTTKVEGDRISGKKVSIVGSLRRTSS